MRVKFMSFLCTCVLAVGATSSSFADETTIESGGAVTLEYVLDEMEKSNLAYKNVRLDAEWGELIEDGFKVHNRQFLAFDWLGRIRIESSNPNSRTDGNPDVNQFANRPLRHIDIFDGDRSLAVFITPVAIKSLQEPHPRENERWQVRIDKAPSSEFYGPYLPRQPWNLVESRLKALRLFVLDIGRSAQS